MNLLAAGDAQLISEEPFPCLCQRHDFYIVYPYLVLPPAGDSDSVVNADIVRLTTVYIITRRKVGIAITPGMCDFEVFNVGFESLYATSY